MGAQSSSLGFGKDLTGSANNAILGGAGATKATGLGLPKRRQVDSKHGQAGPGGAKAAEMK